MQQYTTLILVALMVVAFYFLIMRPQRKRQQEVQRTLNALTPGTRVMLTSGVFGTVVGVGAKQVILEISDGVELTVLKQAVSRVVGEADEDSEYETFADEEDDEALTAQSSGTAELSPDVTEPAPAEPSPANQPTRGEPTRGEPGRTTSN